MAGELTPRRITDSLSRGTLRPLAGLSRDCLGFGLRAPEQAPCTHPEGQAACPLTRCPSRGLGDPWQQLRGCTAPGSATLSRFPSRHLCAILIKLLSAGSQSLSSATYNLTFSQWVGVVSRDSIWSVSNLPGPSCWLPSSAPHCGLFSLPWAPGSLWMSRGASRVSVGFLATEYSPESSRSPPGSPCPGLSPSLYSPRPWKPIYSVPPSYLFSRCLEGRNCVHGFTCHPHLKVKMLSLKYYLYGKSKSWTLEILIN